MPILPATASNLVLDHLDATDDCIALTWRTTCPSASCPVCGAAATRVQSRYPCTLADLPWGGTPVRVHLRIRRFWCDAPTCPRRIFAERFPFLVAAGARRTVRLTALYLTLGLALGGEGGARLATDQQIVGPALRALHSFLKAQDTAQRWGDLHKIITPDGNILWLCAEHRAQYESKPLVIDHSIQP